MFTTNHPERLDPRSLRLGPCSHEQLRRLLDMYFPGAPKEARATAERELLARVPDGAATPALLSSIFQHHRQRIGDAVRALASEVEPARSDADAVVGESASGSHRSV